MAVKVEVLSEETIKPSSQTPLHLRTYKFSLLDNLLSPYYVSIILFYAAPAKPESDDHGQDHYDAPHHNSTTRTRSNLLKRSLAQTLTRFYPVAGRVKDNISIDCNDEGVDYFEARVNSKISDFMNQLHLIHQLLPPHILPTYFVAKEASQLVVQVNMFACGGMAISVCISHKIADASTLATFIKTWASTTRAEPAEGEAAATEKIVVCPTFESVSLFPALPGAGKVVSPPPELALGEKVLTKRFIFDASKTAALRERIAKSRSTIPTSSCMVSLPSNKYPTRVLAVSALLWKSAMDVSRVNSNSSKPLKYVLNYAVNLRGRMDPPLPEVSFGNIFTDARAEWSGVHVELDDLVGQLRLAISKINGDYISNLQQGISGGAAEVDDNDDKVVQDYWMTSWCKLPLYEIDFGWGKPLWMCSNTTDEYKNTFVLMDTRCGEGIEAWVNLEEKDMAIFEQNQELLEFAYNSHY